MGKLSHGLCAVAVWLSASAAVAGSTAQNEGYSVSEPVRTAPLRFTLLEPTWLLPPPESLAAAAALEQEDAIDAQVLHARGPLASRPPSPGGPVSYSLTDGVSAQLRYRHAFMFGTADSEALRVEGPRSFSSRPDRDVFGLNMSWRLAGSTVGLGYQLESAREQSTDADAGLSRFLPGSEQATHSLTFGLTREWGGRDAAPPPPEVPFIAEAEPEPTPAAIPTP